MTRNGKTAIAQLAKDRQAVHCYLTTRSHLVLNTFAEENGVSVTSLVEALCESLDERIEKNGYGCDPDWVRRARKIDAFRRRRG